jgi:hypothetical protein
VLHAGAVHCLTGSMATVVATHGSKGDLSVLGLQGLKAGGRHCLYVCRSTALSQAVVNMPAASIPPGHHASTAMPAGGSCALCFSYGRHGSSCNTHVLHMLPFNVLYAHLSWHEGGWAAAVLPIMAHMRLHPSDAWLACTHQLTGLSVLNVKLS